MNTSNLGWISLRAILISALVICIVILVAVRWGSIPGPWFEFGNKKEEKTEIDMVFEKIREAEKIVDPYKRCVEYPPPRGYEWPDGLIKGMCENDFIPSISYRKIERRIKNNEADKVVTQFDSMIEEYFEGNLPEGPLYNAYIRNFSHSDTSVTRLLDIWHEQTPTNPHLHTARGFHLKEKASGIRGGEKLSSVSYEHRVKMASFLDQAIEQFELAIKGDERMIPAYYGLMYAARLNGQRRLVEKTYNQFLDIDETSFAARAQMLVSTYRRWGGSIRQMEELLGEADAYMDKNPGMSLLRSEGVTIQGMDLGFYGVEHDDASEMAYYERAIQYGPRISALNKAAYGSRESGEQVKAIEYFSQILRFSPNHLRARRSRVALLVRLEQYEWATDDLKYLMQVSSQDAWSQRRYGWLLKLTGKPEQALEILSRQLHTANDNEWLHRVVASIYMDDLNRPDLAGPFIENMVKNFPDSGAVRLVHLQYLDNYNKPGITEAARAFIAHADPDDVKQKKVIPVAEKWLDDHVSDSMK